MTRTLTGTTKQVAFATDTADDTAERIEAVCALLDEECAAAEAAGEPARDAEVAAAIGRTRAIVAAMRRGAAEQASAGWWLDARDADRKRTPREIMDWAFTGTHGAYCRLPSWIRDVFPEPQR